MECILLAAGYATRLYPLTENKPKALLTLGKKTILDLVVEKIEKVDDINHIYIVTNHRFAEQFSEWAKGYKGCKKVEVLDDGTTNNDNRLGAIGDINFVIKEKNITDELFVLASDNIFDFELTDMMDLFRSKNGDVISAHYIEDKNTLKAMGVVKLEEDGKVTEFVEKPAEPQSNYGALPFYIYRKSTVPMIDKYLKDGNNPDAPGYFVGWLVNETDVYAYQFDVMAIDIGTPESYYEAQKLFE
mgnify:CR=1 FL=1